MLDKFDKHSEWPITTYDTIRNFISSLDEPAMLYPRQTDDLDFRVVNFWKARERDTKKQQLNQTQTNEFNKAADV